MRWDYLPEQPERAAALSRELGLAPLAARVLVNRAEVADAADAATFLAPRLAALPDPFLMLGMDRAVARVTAAVRAGEPLCIYGDYDVDGVTATCVLVSFFRSLGARVEHYVPHRLAEGYGLNIDALARIAARGLRLVLTVDTGISAVAEVDRAAELGLEVIVIDHHRAPPELPRAHAILNPHQPGCPFPAKELSAVGVAFMLAMALRKRLREDGFFAAGGRAEPNLRELLDLVALGTIADLVPLTGANRILVHHGLREIAAEARPGLRALKRIAGLDPGPVGARHVAFRLAPRINAAGRLDDAGRGVELLLTDSESRARALAAELDAANLERQAIEKRIAVEAIEQAHAFVAAGGAEALVLASEGWHAGVIGIVASRIVERFSRPTVVIAMENGVGKGSGRTAGDFHLYDAFARCGEHLDRFGGHKAAAGLTVRAERVGDFRAAFVAHARDALAGADTSPRCRIDARVRPDELDLRAVESLDRLGPFGMGNPEPVFAAESVASESPRVVGDNHLKLRLGGLDAIGFRMASRLSETSTGPLDAAFSLEVDEYLGRRRVQLRLRDLRPAA